jgi:hypothetical protein
MRINLKTSFQDRHKVKALGAKWDIARGVWYIEDMPNLNLFKRWIPELSGWNERRAVKEFDENRARERAARRKRKNSD